MLKKISKIDAILLVAALLSLIVSEVFFFQGFKMEAIFIGLWVPSILGFACLIKLIRQNHD
jgi:hypothetical protein